MARTSLLRASIVPSLSLVWFISSCRSWTTTIHHQCRRVRRRPAEDLLKWWSPPHPSSAPIRIPSADAAICPSHGPRRTSQLNSFSSSNDDGSWGPPVSGINNNGGNNNNNYDTALCIVPPDEAWDTLQRARHVARDDSFTIWPPAIRLFHPIPSGLLDPLEVAKVVERHSIEPFEVRLSQWAVIPHVEAMSAQLEAIRSSSTTSDDNVETGGANSRSSSSSTDPSSGGMDYDEEIRRAQSDALIEREERLGRINKEKRDRQREKRRAATAAAAAAAGMRTDTNDLSKAEPSSKSSSLVESDDAEGTSVSLSPRETLQEQKKMYDEFNGPCVVCLEPDPDSKAKLVELRDLLLRELFGKRSDFVDLYSPTATVAGPSNHAVYRGGPHQRRRQTGTRTTLANAEEYRPLVPIGAFGTVNEAIRMARKLRQLWNPLNFAVTDLHVVSMSGGEGDGWSASVVSPSSSGLPMSSSSLAERSFLAKPPQMGCDAMIMLMGQEVPVDQDEGLEMTRILCERGEPGGAVRQTSSTSDAMESSRQRSRSVDHSDGDGNDADDEYDDLLQFLDEDDVDEGTVVVIGRTHFFTGEMRHYVGMPATSTTEYQAAISTTGSSGDTGASRRKGAVHPSRLQDGEFGHVPLSDTDDDMYI